MGEVGPAPRLLPSRSSALLLYGPLALLLPLAAWDFLTTRRMDVVLFLLALAVVGLLGLRQVLLTTDLLRSGRGLLHQQSLFEETQAVGRIGSWEIDLAAQTYTCSPENSRLFGLTHASHHPLDAILANLHPDDRQPSMEAIEATIRDGKGELLQRILLPNGKLRYLRSRGELRRDAQGQPARVVGMSIDVTAQQEAAAALNASDERFRLASLATRDVIWDWDVARGRTQYSEAMKLTFGHDPKDLAGPGAFGRLVNSEDVVKYGESAARLMSGDVDSFVGEYRFRHADGTWRDVLDRARIVKDAQGRVVRIFGAMQDVTEQKRREALLSQAQSIAAMASWEADLLTGRVQWSPEAFRLFDLEPGTPMTYESWLGRIHPEDRERAKAAADGVVAKGQPAEFVCRIVRRDGSIRHTFNKTIPTLADGKVVRLTGINQDITEKHEAEARAAEVRRLQEVTAFKTQFLNTAAHELATPLTPIKLQMASLRRSIFGELTPRQLEAIGLLDRNLVRLDLLVQDLLDAARLQGGKMRLTKKPMAVAPVVRDVLQSFAEKARQDGIHLSGRGLEQSIEVDGDEARLTQVLVNLVSNAFKFTPRGGHVEVSSSRDGAEAVLAVRDTGLGLEPDQIARLFQPFTQVHDQAKHNLGGTGLGLYISHGIMAQLGGTLACRSDGRGKGATFEVRLPLRVATAGRPSGAAAATPA